MAVTEPWQGEPTVTIGGTDRTKLRRVMVRPAVTIANGTAEIELDNSDGDYNDISRNDAIIVKMTDKWNSSVERFRGYVQDTEGILQNQGKENILLIKAADDTNKLHYRFITANEFYVWEIGDLVKEICSPLSFDTTNVSSTFVDTQVAAVTSYDSGANTTVSGGVSVFVNWNASDSYFYVKVRAGAYEFRMGEYGSNGAYFEFYEGSTRLSYYTLNDWDWDSQFEVRVVFRGSEFRMHVIDSQLNTYTKTVDSVDETDTTDGKVEIGSDAGNSTFEDIKVIAEANLIEHYQAKGKSYFDALYDMAEAKAINGTFHDFWALNAYLYFKQKGYASTGITIEQRDAEPDGTNCAIEVSRLKRSMVPVRNKIIVNGATVEASYPWDEDQFTEQDAGNWFDWYEGVKEFPDVATIYGTSTVSYGGTALSMQTLGGTNDVGIGYFCRNFPKALDLTDYNKLKHDYSRVTGDARTVYVRLYKDTCQERDIGSDDTNFSIGTTKYAMSFVAGVAESHIKHICFKRHNADPSTGTTTVELCSDSSGSPGTVLATATSTRGSLSTKWMLYDVEYALTPGTTYWVTIQMSSITGTYYLHHTTGSGMLYWTGSAWASYAGAPLLKILDRPSTDYFQATYSPSATSYTEVDWDIGATASVWSTVGSPDWSAIKSMSFHFATDSGGMWKMYVDHFRFERPSDRISVVAEDSASQTSFDIRELIINDATASSRQRAKDVANAKLALLKDEKLRGRTLVNGNALLEPGKTVTVDIPDQSINSEVLRILEAVHLWDAETGGYVCQVVLDEEIPIFEQVLKNQERNIAEVRARIAYLEAIQESA